jgi:hypothetical protein
MVQFRLSSRIIAAFGRPSTILVLASPRINQQENREYIPNHFPNKLLPRWLLGIKQSQEHKQLPLIARIRLQLRLFVHIDQEDAKIASRSALACFEEGLRNREQDVDCGVPGLGLDVAGGDNAGLLLCFIVLSFCDSSGHGISACELAGRRDGGLGQEEILFLQTHNDLLDFGGHFGGAGPGGGH